MSPTDIERFHTKYKQGKSDECWTWLYGLDTYGYGQFWLDRHNWNSHKIAL